MKKSVKIRQVCWIFREKDLHFFRMKNSLILIWRCDWDSWLTPLQAFLCLSAVLAAATAANLGFPVAHHAVAHHAVAHPVAHHAVAHPVAHHAVAHHAPHHLAHPVVHAAPVIHRSSYRILADPVVKPMMREGKSMMREGKSLEEEMPMQMAEMAEMKAMVEMANMAEES